MRMATNTRNVMINSVGIAQNSPSNDESKHRTVSFPRSESR